MSDQQIISKKSYFDLTPTECEELAEQLEDNDEIEVLPRVFYGGTERFDQEKIEARKKLLEMPPEKAQEIVEQTLYPQNWEVDESSFGWEESIETSYGE